MYKNTCKYLTFPCKWCFSVERWKSFNFFNHKHTCQYKRQDKLHPCIFPGLVYKYVVVWQTVRLLSLQGFSFRKRDNQYYPVSLPQPDVLITWNIHTHKSSSYFIVKFLYNENQVTVQLYLYVVLVDRSMVFLNFVQH